MSGTRTVAPFLYAVTLQTYATGFGFGDGVAHAPTVAVNRVASFRELDSALMKHAAFSTLEDIG